MKKLVALLSVILIIVIIAGGFIIYYLMNGQQPKNVPTVSYDPGDEFITNLKDSNGLVKADIIIEIKKSKKIKFMTENNYKVRDSIISVLRTQTRDSMDKPDATEKLKTLITQKLKEDLGVEEIVDVYFIEFIVQ